MLEGWRLLVLIVASVSALLRLFCADVSPL
jgi:hypothetical protein